jgi:hypothetical protein
MTMNSNDIRVAQAASGLKFAAFTAYRPPVMVISHERSGTHFLMNSIASAYGYVSQPWVDLDDHHIPINYFHQPSIAGALNHLADRQIAAIVKSHHPSTFFENILDEVLGRYVIFYIHRDPADVMASFFKFMYAWHCHVGPQREDAVAFAAAAPEGRLMRYQTHQRRNMLDRWAQHVEGWYRAAEGRPRLRLVRYQDLRDDYATTVSSFADILRREPTDLTPPARDVNVVNGREPERKLPTPDRQALRALALQEVPDTMRLLGYG